MQSAEERRIAAWILSERTKHLFMQTLPPPDKRLCYTMPGILLDNSLEDNSLGELAKKQKLSIEKSDESQNQHSLEGVLELVDQGNFRKAISMTGTLLTEFGQGLGIASRFAVFASKPFVLDTIWTVRLQLLVAIREYSIANSEIETFADLDSPDLCFQYYPETYPGKKGSMVPFSLRLLHAELPKSTGNSEEVIVRCNKISAVIATILSNLSHGLSEDGSVKIDADDVKQSEILWNDRLKAVQHGLARTFLAAKDHNLVEKVYSGLANNSEKQVKSHLYSLLGRLSLQLGHVKSASDWFQKFNGNCDQSNQKMKALACMHKGFLNVFYGQYVEASKSFQSALQYEPNNCHAANNAGICMLYNGLLEEAISYLDDWLSKQPSNAVTEPVCINLATLYELATSRSTAKKHHLLNQAIQTRGDSFAISAFKL